MLTDECVAGEGEEELAGEDEGGHLARARARGRVRVRMRSRSGARAGARAVRAGPGVVRTRVAG